MIDIKDVFTFKVILEASHGGTYLKSQNVGKGRDKEANQFEAKLCTKILYHKIIK
jgi:hypothetical protein